MTKKYTEDEEYLALRIHAISHYETFPSKPDRNIEDLIMSVTLMFSDFKLAAKSRGEFNSYFHRHDNRVSQLIRLAEDVKKLEAAGNHTAARLRKKLDKQASFYAGVMDKCDDLRKRYENHLEVIRDTIEKDGAWRPGWNRQRPFTDAD